MNISEKTIIGRSSQIAVLLELSREIAKTKVSVLIQGESGTGKELLARFIHQNSLRKDYPFVAINCAALPENLLESELFGYEKGAFTGAFSRKIGKFEKAHKGTLLLDEISNMNFPLQAKLLRSLQEQEIDRLGSTIPIPVDIRIISTTNESLAQAVIERKFREDLFYRLNVILLTIPPLRERKEDIPILVEYFLEKFCLVHGKKILKIENGCMDALMKCYWPGNVRELENTIERAVVLSQTSNLTPSLLGFLSLADIERGRIKETFSTNPYEKESFVIKDMERKLIFKALKETEENRTKAAKLLGISRKTLTNKLRKYEVLSY